MPVKCRYNLSLTTGSVDQSKKAWKGSALNSIHSLLALARSIPKHLCLGKLLWRSETTSPKHKQATWSTSWRDEKLESCPRSEHSQNTVRNMTSKHNPPTLPINLYAVDPPDVQPLDFTKLGDQRSVQHMPQKEVTEFLYTSNQSVCVKDDEGGCWNHLSTSLPTGEGYSWHEKKQLMAKFLFEIGRSWEIHVHWGRQHYLYLDVLQA